MRFKTIKDVIDYSRELHSGLSQQYAELEQLTSSERVQLMLDYLQRHERHLAEVLGRYEENAARGLLDTWLQYAPEFHPNDLLAKARDASLCDLDELVATALEIDACMVKIYADVIENCDLDDVKEVARSLMQLENNEEQNLARSAFRLNDL